MNSFELNKILGAVLGTCLVILSLNIGAGSIFAPEKPAKPGYDIAVKEDAGADKAAADTLDHQARVAAGPRAVDHPVDQLVDGVAVDHSFHRTASSAEP